MCVIMYKKAGSRLPTKKAMRNCWLNNEDGAGIGIICNDTMRVIKGFMTFKDLWMQYRQLKLTKDDSFVIHFRTGTSGEFDGSATHPFPISDNIVELKSLSYMAGQTFFHNGVFGGGDRTLGLSDTQLFVMNILAPLSGMMSDPNVLKSVMGSVSTFGYNKALLFNHGHVHLIGNFVTDKKSGIMYSNYDYEGIKGFGYYRWNGKELVPDGWSDGFGSRYYEDYDGYGYTYHSQGIDKDKQEGFRDDVKPYTVEVECPVCLEEVLEFDPADETFTCYTCCTTFDGGLSVIKCFDRQEQDEDDDEGEGEEILVDGKVIEVFPDKSKALTMVKSGVC